MTGLAVTAWPYIKRALPYLAVALALFALYRVGVSHGKHSRDPEVTALHRENETLSANAATLDAALAHQNAALADAGERARIAQERAGEALARAVAADKAAASLRARAGKLARAKLDGVCISPEGDRLSRDAWGHL